MTRLGGRRLWRSRPVRRSERVVSRRSEGPAPKRGWGRFPAAECASPQHKRLRRVPLERTEGRAPGPALCLSQCPPDASGSAPGEARAAPRLFLSAAVMLLKRAACGAGEFAHTDAGCPRAAVQRRSQGRAKRKVLLLRA